MDLAKRDLAVVYGGRSFAVRVYPDGGGADGHAWRAVIIENRTPLDHAHGSHPVPADCFAEAIRSLVADVEARGGGPTAPA